jgi:thiol-disulfide isomerase/thioredoxin
MAAALIVLAACQPRQAAEAPAVVLPPGNSAAPDFEVRFYQGADVLGSERPSFSELFSQGKPVVLNFWAGLCPPCRAEMPGFQNVYNDLQDQFIMVGLDIGPFVGLGSHDDGRRLLEELGVTYPIATTPDGSVLAAYGVRGMPTTVFLTATGEVFKTHVGLLDERTFRTEVEKLIAAAGTSPQARIRPDARKIDG